MFNQFRVVNIFCAICNFSDNFWEKFKVQTNLSDFQVQILTQQEVTHGLEYIKYNFHLDYIVRRGRDVMLVDQKWENVTVLPLIEKKHVDSFLCQLFYTHAVQQHIIYFHSSLIEYLERGLMFLGPSGIGKTTQAELWNQYRDALIINGDVVFVQETEDAFLGWGTPWHGSSPYCENTSVPVHAMIVLKQAPENSIRELTGFEKVTAVSNNVFYPQWLENGMELCLETLDHLLTNIPVYELSCRPDEDAVRLTEETVFGKRMI